MTAVAASKRKARVLPGSWAHMTDRGTVVRAAAELFDRHGYAETTMQHVADVLHISKPTLYKHARSKSDILQLIIDEWIDQSDQGLESALKLENRSARIPRLVHEWTERAVANSAHLSVFLSDERDMPPQAVARYRAWSGKVYRTFRTMIEDGQATGDYRSDVDATVSAFGILGFILLLPRWLKSGGRLSPAQVADEFLKTLHDGLVAKPSKGNGHG
ncbi:MAG: TetR/AcrR family transcriptional regulator [Sphingomonadales bacterium]